MNKKGRKRLKISISTSFRVCSTGKLVKIHNICISVTRTHTHTISHLFVIRSLKSCWKVCSVFPVSQVFDNFLLFLLDPRETHTENKICFIHSLFGHVFMSLVFQVFHTVVTMTKLFNYSPSHFPWGTLNQKPVFPGQSLTLSTYLTEDRHKNARGPVRHTVLLHVSCVYVPKFAHACFPHAHKCIIYVEQQTSIRLFFHCHIMV